MRTWLIAIILCIFCFILPLQFFTIGNNSGMGIQGAAYRYIIGPQGNSLIPITNEITYVTSGLYTGRTALSVIFWSMGTFILSGTTAGALILWNRMTRRQIQIIAISLIAASLGYLASCIFQYGLLFNGPAGISIPIGVIILLTFTFFLWYYREGFFITAE